VAGAIAVMALAGCGSSDSTSSSGGTSIAANPTDTTAAQADFTGLVDIGNGRSIHMECRGTGSPTVVLVTGLGERADNWMTTSDTPPQPDRSVFSELAESTRVCAYDRPGTTTATTDGTWELSRSTPVAQPATIADSAADLDALLTASGEPGPYVLAGQSLGGPIIRLYAADHPTNVAGLVFVDALSEDLGDGLTPDQLAIFEDLNAPSTQGRPPGSEDPFYSTAVVPLLRAAAPAPQVPTIVLTADTWPITAEAIATGAFPPEMTVEVSDALWASQLRAQDMMAAKFPGAEHVTETNAGHYIHNDNPRLVIDSILSIVDQMRSDPPS
jgi:pimeloyl-ACP methyl ester carboxylesterase